MITTIFDVNQSVIDFAHTVSNHSNRYEGFYAGDGERWIKCADFEAAAATRQKYIFFVKENAATLYQA